MASSNRPLSPHLQVYRQRWTGGLSILHRITGVVLAFGAFGVAWWLHAIAQGDGASVLLAFAASLPGRVLLVAFSTALVYHLLNGLRHLLWDAGWGLELPRARATATAVVILTVVITAALWTLALGGAA